MSIAGKLVPASAPPAPWAAICDQHPNEWVCLVDVENAPDGSIRSARVIGHDPSMRRVLAEIGAPRPDMLVLHTWGRPLRFPRLEVTDEIRDIVHPRR
jgi:hypothetical protein